MCSEHGFLCCEFQIKYVEECDSMVSSWAERYFGPPPTKKIICEWWRRGEELQKLKKNRHCVNILWIGLTLKQRWKNGQKTTETMEFLCLQKWLLLSWEDWWDQKASLILLGHLSVKDLGRGMDCENTVTVVKSFKKCVIINAFDGIEDEVLFEECWSSDNGNGKDDFRGLCNSR